MSLAIIGGTGLNTLAGLEVLASHAVDTPYGQPSMAIEEGVYGGRKLLFLHRHGGRAQPIPPHLVNYRANIWALRELGAERILAANAVGAINAGMVPGKLVVPHQLIDYTWGREHSFDDGSSGELLHVDFTHPYDGELRDEILGAALAVGLPHVATAVLGVVQGPRLESAAEVRRFANDGCDLLGMTGMPEAALARELAIPYAAVCMVVNAAAGVSEKPISMDDIRQTLLQETALFGALLKAFLEQQSGL
ncbi:S-methyl-5'-thioinosine phosphorylase [Congregibacter variabilis]|uniref:Probable S-methyl-5'-thioinosine phosphorylase n=1 Tax=Congregibacter variabilis TaxID=3081200 RepID=A0ABZ0I3Y7_9GAMM|nr:S-methyl-5'-thioinosine phosphorylase [Congregibacter sp. IMCC43200]